MGGACNIGVPLPCTVLEYAKKIPLNDKSPVTDKSHLTSILSYSRGVSQSIFGGHKINTASVLELQHITIQKVYSDMTEPTHSYSLNQSSVVRK